MRHPLHVALSVPPPARTAAAAGPGAAAARHRRPRTSPAHTVLAALARVRPARRLAAGLGLASVLAASVLTAAVDPSAPVAPDRAPARQSSTFAQVSGD
ncbi:MULTISPECIES: hypothetical protein [unclassified Streptomyces]|uniref:hypothetical protein n=1 Tax=unclassified Streptomyces TaxID=2593676 RepID=UPI000DC77D9D|nr:MULTISPECIES: hypothetical protein [unclassified Streptomyces]AWZ03304.1 hypothetical protein DRB89_00060 [Streptomyces sp. ICC4]AWZ15059.1 hypothetical protein DRB96_25510 [Streptomyces sp. ICC1]